MPDARTLPKSQQQFDFQLPRDKQERRQRMKDLRHHWLTLIEALEDTDCDLTKGQRKRVAALMKRWLKSDYANWHGVGTTCRTYLAKEWMMSRRTIEYQLEWAHSIGVIEWSVDTDQRGVRRTTIQIMFVALAELVGLPAYPVEEVDTPPDQSATIAHCYQHYQSATVADQSATVADQSATVADQSATIAQHSPNSITPLPPDDWLAVENLFKDSGIALYEDLVREAKQLELTPADCREIVATFHANAKRFHGPGAITHRVRRGEWPAKGVREARVIQEAEAKKAALQQAARAAHMEAIDQQEQWRSELAALEAAYGAELDALNSDEMMRFVRSVFKQQFEFDRWRRNPHDSYVRHVLLTAVHANRMESSAEASHAT